MRLEKGAKIPSFEIKNSKDVKISDKDILGKWTVLYFYPKDNTPGCTVEAKDFTCLLNEFSDLGVQIIGVSKDSIKSHSNFISKQDLKIELLSDPDMIVHNLFGTWGEKMMYGKKKMGVIRSTFIINPDGELVECLYNVRAKGHAERILKIIKKLV